LTFEDLARELAAGRLRPAYLLAGAEPLLRDDALDAIRRAALDGGPEEFDLDRLDAAGSDPAALRDAVQTLPVMASRRLVVLREPEASRGAGLTDALAELVAQSDDSASSVIVAVSARADARTRWVRAFGEARVDCDPPRRSSELVAFVRREAQRQGLKLERGAAELLAERIGPQLLLLRQELSKAGLLAGVGAPVKRAHVAAGTLDVAEQPIWQLTDAIGEGRAGDALAVLDKLLSGGAVPPIVLAALANHFRRLLRLRGGGALAGPPFLRRKLESQAGRYSERRLVACLRAIQRTDLALKGEGGLPERLVLERLVIGLVG